MLSLALAIVHGLWGMRYVEYDGGPKIADIQNQLLDGGRYTASDVLWAAITTVRQSLARNDSLIQPKAAAYRVVWACLITALVFIVWAGALRVFAP